MNRTSQERPADKAVAATAAEPTVVVLNRLDQAWDAGDGAAFASEFTVDADVINVSGTHFRGRSDLAKQMQQIFNTVFKGSRHASRALESARFLNDDTILAVSAATIDVPAGPLAPQARSRPTFRLVQPSRDTVETASPVSAEPSGRGSDSSRRVRTRQQQVPGNLKSSDSLRAGHGRTMVEKPLEEVAGGQVVEQIPDRDAGPRDRATVPNPALHPTTAMSGAAGGLG